MTSIKQKRPNSLNSHPKNKCTAESVIEELKEKMNRLNFRLLDYQNQNQILRKELLLAKKVIKTEVTEVPDKTFQDLLNVTDFRGRQEKILMLKDKLIELQNQLKELEDGNTEKSSEDLAKSKKVDKLEESKKMFQNKKMMDKELQYLLENSCQLKRKLEVWKKRNAELSKETALLRLELDRLVDKSKECMSVHESYHVVNKELRARQSEKLEMRSKLDLEKTRNEQLSEELATLKEDLSMILSKINDDKVLIDALKNQQGCLIDLLERQKLISESDNRKFQDDMREIQAKHSTNSHVLDHLTDIVEEKTKFCQQVRESMKDESVADESEKQESSISTTTYPDLTSQSESQQSSPIPADELPPGNEEASPAESEIMKVKEEIEQHKNIFQSINEEVGQLTNIVFANNNKMNEWMAELFNTNSLLAQKNAEIRDLEETYKKLQKPPSFVKNESTSIPQGSNFAEEMQIRIDVLQEEYEFLVALWDLLITNKENSLEVLFISSECTRKQFINTILDLLSEDDMSGEYEESPQTEEQSQS